MTSPEEVQAVIERVIATPDPAERARTIGRVLELIRTTINPLLRDARQAAVQEMRSAGMSHQDVAAELGVARGRAQQIAEGRRTGKRKTVEEPAAG